MGNEILDPCDIGSGSCRRRWYSERERSIAERWIFAEFGEDARKFSYRGACAYGIAQQTPASNIHRISDRIIFFFSSSFLSQNVVGFRGLRGFRSFRAFRNSRPTRSRPTRGYQTYQLPGVTKPTSYPGFPAYQARGFRASLPTCGVSGLPACGVPIIC